VLVAPVEAPAAASSQARLGQPEADHDQRTVLAMRRYARV
jgi:hypothetical protein